MRREQQDEGGEIKFFGDGGCCRFTGNAGSGGVLK
jgi:hypothetical protein